uniref:Uncharacterized protein n=1 Tax=Ditylenchus dipsaci TaxID=166011 RepID=A0A915EL54_9BILA
MDAVALSLLSLYVILQRKKTTSKKKSYLLHLAAAWIKVRKLQRHGLLVTQKLGTKFPGLVLSPTVNSLLSPADREFILAKDFVLSTALGIRWSKHHSIWLRLPNIVSFLFWSLRIQSTMVVFPSLHVLKRWCWSLYRQ